MKAKMKILRPRRSKRARANLKKLSWEVSRKAIVNRRRRERKGRKRKKRQKVRRNKADNDLVN